jgi:hypothetical protein
VERARGGNLRTREGVRAGMLRMKLALRALRKVKREGDPNARCQYETNRARGRAWRVKREEGGETIGEATGTVRVQRSALTGLKPVRKGKAAEGESKIFTEVLISEDGKPVRANERGDPKQRV